MEVYFDDDYQREKKLWADAKSIFLAAQLNIQVKQVWEVPGKCLVTVQTKMFVLKYSKLVCDGNTGGKKSEEPEQKADKHREKKNRMMEGN